MEYTNEAWNSPEVQMVVQREYPMGYIVWRRDRAGYTTAYTEARSDIGWAVAYTFAACFVVNFLVICAVCIYNHKFAVDAEIATILPAWPQILCAAGVSLYITDRRKSNIAKWERRIRRDFFDQDWCQLRDGKKTRRAQRARRIASAIQQFNAAQEQHEAPLPSSASVHHSPV